MDYNNYLKLDDLLACQNVLIKGHNKTENHEMFFIIMHQTHELWFKQILQELDLVIKELNRSNKFFLNTNGIKRITEILRMLNNQILLFNTLEAKDFLEFRSLLMNASGFHSFQFRLLELRLGLYDDTNLKYLAFYGLFTKQQRKYFYLTSNKKSLYQSIDDCLRNYIDLAKNFFQFNDISSKIFYSNLNHRNKLKQLNDFIYNQELYKKKYTRLSHASFLSILFLFINQNNFEYKKSIEFIRLIVDTDKNLMDWRHNHLKIVHRLIDNKRGTGDTSGYNYLKNSIESKTIFSDFKNLLEYFENYEKTN